VDAHAKLPGFRDTADYIHERSKKARLIIFGDIQKEAECMELLWHGVRGILNYSEAREQLPQALVLVAGGGLGSTRDYLSLHRFD